MARRATVFFAVWVGVSLLPVAALAQTTDGGAELPPLPTPPPTPTPNPTPSPNPNPTPITTLTPNPSSTPSSGDHRFADLVSLRLMHERKIITDAEYASALEEIGASTGGRAEDAVSLVVGKWSATLYGFLEGDYIFDTTQSFADGAGNSLVARPNGFPPPPPAPQSTFAGDHARLQFGVRNTRLGLRMRAPETHRIRASGTLEMDFLGFDPAPPTTTEAAFFTSPTLRVRHAYLKIETPIVDILIGQYWHLFGWQPFYFPNTVEIQGLPGELYARTPQLRISHKFQGPSGSLEIAGAAMRPPMRDGAVPELTGGIRLTLDKWRGMQTTGATSTTLAPASFGITGDFRDFRVPEFAAVPKAIVELPTGAIAVDGFLPLIPATEKRKGNALSLSGEFVYGAGITDLYSSFTGGMTFPSLPNTTGVNPPPAYPQNVDNGMVAFDNVKHDLHAIQWATFMLGLQYYVPGVHGHIWVSANYAHTESPNVQDFTNPSAAAPNPLTSNYPNAALVRKFEDWVDGNVFFDVVPGVRLGLEYAYFNDRYVDGTHASNHRVQMSGYFLF